MADLSARSVRLGGSSGDVCYACMSHGGYFTNRSWLMHLYYVGAINRLITAFIISELIIYLAAWRQNAARRERQVTINELRQCT